MSHAQYDLKYWLSTQAIRDGAEAIYEECKNGQTHFILHEDKMEDLAARVAEVCRKNYPSLEIPYHSRWRHFDVLNESRSQQFKEKLKEKESKDRIRSEIDLLIVSVVLDAGAGSDWKYTDPSTGQKVGRSEGLALASLDAFENGFFSNSESEAYQVQAERLEAVSLQELSEVFQISESNPLAGLEGRLELLKSLGKVVSESDYFPKSRPGSLWDYWSSEFAEELEATDLLLSLLQALGPIWPSRLELDGVPLGDVWNYKDHKLAFHKLSQWLTYSLIDTIRENGLEVLHVQRLTGLAEYRNGGLFVDSGVLSLKDESLLSESHRVDSELILEWRALTIALLDRLLPHVQKALNKADLSLPAMLEGGSWATGRLLAKEKRQDGSSPIKIQSDGTVF